MRNRKLNIGLLVFFGVLLLGVAFAGWVVYALYTGRLFGYEPPRMPAGLEGPRVARRR